ncbi:MAG: HEPN domain-containing protein [Chloroflexota bacterium]
MNAKLKLVRNWLVKAQHDLASAQKLAEGSDPYLDVAIYHRQQAAEKAIKGFLVFQDRPLAKTHDLVALTHLLFSTTPTLPIGWMPLFSRRHTLQNFLTQAM